MYIKKGFPERDELVICIIDRVMPHSAFVKLEEYDNLEGMVHTSEMDRRWVRYMKTHLKIGRKLVCKVMRVDTEKKHIDLSIRRVGEGQKRAKLAEWANEAKADDLLKVFAKQCKLKPAQVFKKVGEKALDKYGSIYPCLVEVTKDEKILDKICSDKKLSEKLCEFIKKRIVIPKTIITGVLELKSFSDDGVSIIKNAVKKAGVTAKKLKVGMKMVYLGSGKYQIQIKSEDSKQAQKTLDTIIEMFKSELKKNKGTAEFTKK